MRWLVVVPFERPEHIGVDLATELRERGHEVSLFAYRRDNILDKNRVDEIEAVLHERFGELG